MLRAIVVVDKNYAIGRAGQLLVHVPEDLKHFRQTTAGGILIYGRKTLATFPGAKPLPKRENWILTRYPGEDQEGLRYFTTREELLSAIEADEERRYWIIGGASVYEQFLDECEEVVLTALDYEATDPDRYFPRVDRNPEWQLVHSSEPQPSVAGFSFQVQTYQRIHHGERR